MNKIHALINSLKQQNLTLAIAESMTCGMATDKLSGVKGISKILRGSIVCYTPEVKMKLMGVQRSVIEKYTCESMEVTTKLTEKLSGLIPADIHAAITGLASPGGSETKTKPVGTVFLVVRYKKRLYKQRKVFKGSPVRIKRQACHALYDFIKHIVKKKH